MSEIPWPDRLDHTFSEQSWSGKRQEVFMLKEGDVTITFPTNMSLTGWEDLRRQLDFLITRIQENSGKHVAPHLPLQGLAALADYEQGCG